MLGTQAPKGFGIAFVLIGIPLIIWNASGTNKQLAALDTSEAREARCITNTASVEITPELRQDLCHCVVKLAEQQGATQPYGGTDKEALKPLIEKCYEIHAQP